MIIRIRNWLLFVASLERNKEKKFIQEHKIIITWKKKSIQFKKCSVSILIIIIITNKVERLKVKMNNNNYQRKTLFIEHPLCVSCLSKNLCVFLLMATIDSLFSISCTLKNIVVVKVVVQMSVENRGRGKSPNTVSPCTLLASALIDARMLCGSSGSSDIYKTK